MSTSSSKVGVGLIGLGAIGRLHFDCWSKATHGRVVAIATRDPRKRAGEWPASEFNLGDQAASKVNLEDVAGYAEAAELFADPRVQIVDICASTPHHAQLAIAALRAGKHVICEKPMALSLSECRDMAQAARTAGRELMVAHCLRYWPHYLKVYEFLRGGDLGPPLYARLYRRAAMPGWSDGGWLARPEQSGGVLDMHIHDIDVALWWFGEPLCVEAAGVVQSRLPLIMDATWHYSDGPLLQLHSAWDPNGGAFCHGFRVVLEKGTLLYDLEITGGALHLMQEGKITEIPLEAPAAHLAELDDFARCIATGQPFTRFTPEESQRAVEVGLLELSALE